VVWDGSLAEGADLVQEIEFPDELPVASITSEPLRVHPVASPAKITIKTLTLSVTGESAPLIFSNIPIEFSTALEPGKTYLLDVRFKKNRWAGSNIYWDGEKLTFDAFSSTTLYQGVFFKWGSLIGISPHGGTAAEDVDALPIYIPPVNGGEWAMKTVGTDHALWAATPKSYENIPYYTTVTSAGWEANALYGENDFTEYTGDICSYLTSGVWRMPSRAELGYPSSSSLEFGVLGNVLSSNAFGTGIMGWGRAFTFVSDGYAAIGYVRFPASGFRDPSGVLTWQGNDGSYWTGSDLGSNHCQSLRFGRQGPSGYIYTGDINASRDYAYSIRCLTN
jgi:hypothetical protein